jgi:energy-converting hydrogenase A subunit M
MKEIYALVGELMETCQYIEHNLAVIICYKVYAGNDESKVDALFEKMSTSTLGQVMKIVRDSDEFAADTIQEMQGILADRNEIVHQFFKKNDFNKHYKNAGFIENKRRYLANRLREMNEMNAWLCTLIKK